MSDHGIRRLKKILKIDEKSELVPTREETLGLVFKTSLECCKRHFGKDKAVSLNHYYMRNGLAIDDLLKTKCIDMVQGEIVLLEKLYLMK